MKKKLHNHLMEFCSDDNKSGDSHFLLSVEEYFDDIFLLT
jgi:hypothetical protein